MINKFSIFDLMPNQEVLPLNPKFPCLVKWVWKKHFSFLGISKKITEISPYFQQRSKFPTRAFLQNLCGSRGRFLRPSFSRLDKLCRFAQILWYPWYREFEEVSEKIFQPREPYFQWFINLNKNPFPWDIKSPTFLSWICDMVFC